MKCDTQHNGGALLRGLSFMLTVTYAESHYDECRHAVCRYAACGYAECPGSLFISFISIKCHPCLI